MDELPPHSQEAEAACLGCVLLQGESSQAEVEALLSQLRPNFFFDLRNRTMFEHMTKMKMEGHAIDVSTLSQWLKGHNELENAGGIGYIAELPDKVPTLNSWKFFFDQVKEFALRRWCIAKTATLQEMSKATELSLETIRAAFEDISDKAQQIGLGKTAMINIITPAKAREFEPDPKDYLVGEGLIVRGMTVTIGGEPGVGKSRLATTLAVAGARGTSKWQNYPIRTKWKTLILQSENSGSRLKEEFMAVPKGLDDFIRVSDGLTHGLAFDNIEFRRELRRFFDSWPFEMLVLDPWNDISSEEGQKDYKQALLNIKSVFNGAKCPAIIIVAHLRKKGRDDNGRRKTGRELLHELSGSLALGSSSRTVFAIQPVSPDMDDPRIVFEIAKANDANPAWLKEVGTRSAWNRANGAFESVTLDWDVYDNPQGQERRAISFDMLLEAFGERPGMKKKELSKALIAVAKKKGMELGESTVYRAISKGGYLADDLTEVAGIFGLNEGWEDK